MATFLFAVCSLAQGLSSTGTTRFVLDCNRTYAEVGVVRPYVAVRRRGIRRGGGVLPGDTLIRVGDLETKGASWGAIYDVLHGEAGEPRSLLLERDGRRLTVATNVTGF